MADSASNILPTQKSKEFQFEALKHRPWHTQGRWRWLLYGTADWVEQTRKRDSRHPSNKLVCNSDFILTLSTKAFHRTEEMTCVRGVWMISWTAAHSLRFVSNCYITKHGSRSMQLRTNLKNSQRVGMSQRVCWGEVRSAVSAVEVHAGDEVQLGIHPVQTPVGQIWGEDTCTWKRDFSKLGGNQSAW